MIKIGIVSNPNSTRNKRGLHRLRAALSGRPDMIHAEVSGIGDVGAAMADFARHEVGLVIVNGGDGTVRAVLTELFDEGPFATVPPITALAGGMSNMIAHDVGVVGNREKALARIEALSRSGDIQRSIVSRRLIRMEQPSMARPQFGMFLVSAAIYDMTEANRKLHRIGIRDPYAIGVTLGRFAVRRLLAIDRSDSWYRGKPIAIELDGQCIFDGASLVLIITTLDRCLLNFKPFWGTGDGPLRLTNVAFPAPRFLRLLPQLLYGRTDGDLPPGYMSENSETVTLRMDCPLILDGDTFEPHIEAPVTLSGRTTARFLHLT